MSYLYVYCILILLGIIKKDSKFVAVLIFLFAWILLGWNYDNPDIDNYVWNYEVSDTWFGAFVETNSVEPGYSLLCYVGNLLGFSFMTFKQILAAIAYAMITLFVFRVGKNYALIASCYLVSFFLMDVIQLRNFFAMAVLLFGFRYLLKPNMEKMDAVKYIICAIVATSIHVSMVFSLVLVLARRPIKRIFVLALIVVVFLLKASIFGFFSTTLDTEKVTIYEGLSSLQGGLFSSFIFCANAIFIVWVYNKYCKKNRIGIAGSFPEILTVKNINLLLLILIPFLFDNASFSRLLKDVLIVNYAFLAINLKGKEKMFMYGYALFYLVYYVSFGERGLLVFNTVFKYNNFFVL